MLEKIDMIQSVNVRAIEPQPKSCGGDRLPAKKRGALEKTTNNSLTANGCGQHDANLMVMPFPVVLRDQRPQGDRHQQDSEWQRDQPVQFGHGEIKGCLYTCLIRKEILDEPTSRVAPSKP